MPIVEDMLGRQVDLSLHPKRIVSLVPSQTELLADLGMEEEVVGITKFCVHPEKWFRSKTRVGGTKTVHIDWVHALAPDLIIANKEENVQEQIDSLQELAPVWVSDIHTLDDALQMIKKVGVLCGKEEGANKIVAGILQGFAALPLRIYAGNSAAYGIWRDPWMWAGGDTFIHDIMQRAGLHNVLQHVPRYPELSLEALKNNQPDLILLSSEPYPFKETHISEVKAALPETKVMLVDGEMFSWYGSRLLHAPKYLAGLLQHL